MDMHPLWGFLVLLLPVIFHFTQPLPNQFASSFPRDTSCKALNIGQNGIPGDHERKRYA